MRIISLILAFLSIVAPITKGAVLIEDFAGDPQSRGWQTFGDSSLFGWNSPNQNLAITWDSSKSNSFFYFPLRTILTKAEDFSFAFDLRLRDIQMGASGTKSNTFEIAVGLLNSRTITNANYFRGAGQSATYGVRNLVEFDYFPDDGFGATFASSVVSTNNRIRPAHNFPLEMTTGDLFRITLTYTAGNQTLRTSATKNGAPFGLSPANTLADLSLTTEPDFRIDAFGISSYSDAVQTGSPDFWGSVLAHGELDNVVITMPTPPSEPLLIVVSNAVPRITTLTRTNWTYVLQHSGNFADWGDASASVSGTGSALTFVDQQALPANRFYRVRMERP